MLFNGDCKGVGPFAGVWGGAPRKKDKEEKIPLPYFEVFLLSSLG